jgi:hypothetical protein
LEEAARSVSRISKKGSTVDPKDTVSMMVRTNEKEIAMTAGAGYLDCFKGTDLRRTEIACVSCFPAICQGVGLTIISSLVLQDGMDGAEFGRSSVRRQRRLLL